MKFVQWRERCPEEPAEAETPGPNLGPKLSGALKLADVDPLWLFGWWFGTFFIFPYAGNSHPN